MVPLIILDSLSSLVGDCFH